MRSSFRQTRGGAPRPSTTIAVRVLCRSAGSAGGCSDWLAPMSQQSSILISCFLTSLKHCFIPDENHLREAVTVIVVPFDELDLKQSSLTHKQYRKRPFYLET